MAEVEHDAESHFTTILHARETAAETQVRIADSELKLQPISKKTFELTWESKLTQHQIIARTKELEEAKAHVTQQLLVDEEDLHRRALATIKESP